MADDEWVKVAMTDDSVVVELLIRLNQSPELPPVKRSSPAPPLKWSSRQRRSKPLPRIVGEDMKGESTGASPTTPLSWSGGTSVSGGAVADASEESSRPVIPSNSARSKIMGAIETTTTKRPKKKKTLNQLREEESQLLKERKHLENELASLNSTVNKQRAANESLKRMKFDMQLQSASKTVATSLASEQATAGQYVIMETTCDPLHSDLRTSVACNDPSAALHQSHPSGSFKLPKVKDDMNLDKLLLLPDLNLPCEEVSGSEVLHAVS